VFSTVRPALSSDRFDEALSRPAEARPVVLEGRWLDESADGCWVASEPASVLEGPGEALGELPKWLDRHFHQYPEGSAIGMLAYELARHFEALPLALCAHLPDISFAYYPRLERLRLSDAPAQLSETNPHTTRFERPAVGRCCVPPSEPQVDFQAYSLAVERIRSLIGAGDIYQANLTIPFCVELGDETPDVIYRRMRANGAPFRAFLKTPERTILSNSPERFFRVSGKQILTSPIKGTIVRDPADAGRSIASLLASEKDRAENLMIVDLLRNDLGRICDYGSIRARLWDTEILPHLIHLVSHVEGTLRPEVGFVDILRALFPCGSITGAPKIRAMEILAATEQAPRGISMGAIGIIRSATEPDRCRMDFNVAIRTMILEEGKALFHVGGGIVYDSDPVSEYSEVMLKARPLFEALGASDGLYHFS
jgi:para-aminobenzoate synthetase component 1